ncbi:hypothetical protein EVAR_25064_1 [Eumeta japonica]|uniref:Uncharacterized protein n=1 Tax=Eumeta variegata TaxID=151549 RepID=A0A4C1V7D9_EUMVA|nr:hypothetical protein EVAR_25064_1 [Eumeta japonica]
MRLLQYLHRTEPLENTENGVVLRKFSNGPRMPFACEVMLTAHATDLNVPYPQLSLSIQSTRRLVPQTKTKPCQTFRALYISRLISFPV